MEKTASITRLWRTRQLSTFVLNLKEFEITFDPGIKERANPFLTGYDPNIHYKVWRFESDDQATVRRIITSIERNPANLAFKSLEEVQFVAMDGKEYLAPNLNTSFIVFGEGDQLFTARTHNTPKGITIYIGPWDIDLKYPGNLGNTIFQKIKPSPS